MLKENIDQKLFFNFTDKYYQLYEEGKITQEQLDEILALIENYQNYNPQEFKDELQKVFD